MLTSSFISVLVRLRIGMGPDINNLVVTFIVGNETHVIVIQYFFNFNLGIYESVLL